ncbi:MAG: YqgE/AlgH family protein [Pseudomonadota bacterium]
MTEDLQSSRNPRQDYLAGTMLIAMPNMRDERFERAVLFMCAHDANHAMGIVINKPLEDITLGALLLQLDVDATEAAEARSVMFGGPVQTDRGFVLHTLDYRTQATMAVTPELGLTATKEVLVDMAGLTPKRKPPRRSVLALGYAGWGEGQLEAEIGQNAWLHCAADPDLIFDEDSDGKWRKALARLGVTDAMFSSEWADTRNGNAPLH